MECKEITVKDVKGLFSVKSSGDVYELTIGSAKPIIVSLPFVLDKDIARICGMIFDGYLAKNFSSVSFTQGKDISKVKEFGKILSKRFGVNPRYRIGYSGKNKNKYMTVDIGSKSLSYFLYYLVGMHKSDEDAKIPEWVWESDRSLIVEYLRYAFAMEGSVQDPLNGCKEIRFHSCDKPVLMQIRKILLTEFKIKTRIYTYHIKNYGEKYFLYILGKENVTKFLEIGFALKTHQKRLEKVVNSYKSKAWEITLVSIPKIKKNRFRICDVNKLFPYLCKRAVHHRLTDLVTYGFLGYSTKGYFITKKGLDKTILIKCKVKILSLRTKSRDNEKVILKYLSKRRKHRNGISHDMKINANTVGDTLKRLKEQGLIRLVKIDKFQRKIYEKKKIAGEGNT